MKTTHKFILKKIGKNLEIALRFRFNAVFSYISFLRSYISKFELNTPSKENLRCRAGTHKFFLFIKIVNLVEVSIPFHQSCLLLFLAIHSKTNKQK